MFGRGLALKCANPCGDDFTNRPTDRCAEKDGGVFGEVIGAPVQGVFRKRRRQGVDVQPGEGDAGVLNAQGSGEAEHGLVGQFGRA